MVNNQYQSELYMIAEEAHKGASDRDIRQICSEIAYDFGLQTDQVYADSQAVFLQNFT